MRIQRVLARAFGPFHGASLAFAPGMTVVAGPNEAGKSSWHAATRLALTGLRRGRGRATAADAALAERHRPWDDPDEWSVEALLQLDDGRIVEIRQDLAGKVACAAIDVGLGRDVSDEILDGTPDASRWLGLDRDSFATTVSVSQAQVLAVAGAAEQLQEQMQRAAATRGTDATAAQAIERLTEFRREAVGADTVAARGPLRAAKTRLSLARQALLEAQARHADYLERAARAELAERRLSDARGALEIARWAQATKGAERAALRARRAAELSARHPQAPAPLADRTELADVVAAAIDAWVRRPRPLDLDGPPSAELVAELHTLPENPVGDVAPDEAVIAAARELDLAEEGLRIHGTQPAVAQPPPLPSDRIRSIARRLRAPTLASPDVAVGRGHGAAPAWPRPATALGVALLVAALGVALVGAPLAAGALAGLGVVIAVLGLLGGGSRVRTDAALTGGRGASPAPVASAERREALDEARAAGLPLDPSELDELADRAVVAERDHAELERWRARHAELASRRAAAAAALRDALVGRGIPVDTDVRLAWDAYRADCERRGRQAGEAMRRQSLERELVARRQAEAAEAAAEMAVDRARDALVGAARAAGMAGVDEPDVLVTALRAWQAARAEALRAGETESAEWRELHDLLGRGSLADLADDAARRLAESRELESLLPHDMPREVPDELDAAIEERSAAVAAADRAWHELKGALETLAPGLPDVAAAEEEAIAAEAELGRVESLAATVDETLRLLRSAQETVHRNLAPILADAVRRWLPSISGGAYTEVSVDPADLSVKVKEARTGQWRTAMLLSEGTREQVYLLLRVAMAQHLVTTGETAPLLLDEVTAQADGERREAVLSMLHDLSRERQVVLFSHDPEVARWADAHLKEPGDCLVRLPALSTPGGGTVTTRSRALSIGQDAASPAASDPEPVALLR
ncbi:MAG TPA: AAA family ATPase [Candidatus Limnocylindria bacterium]|nr:AAA family ATPase [Candidatus Limnocylindria bacterium]